MRIVECEQGSQAWYEARIGIPTASQFHRILTPGGKPSGQALAYMYRLIAERLLNESMDDYVGTIQWMERGKLLEGDAREQFKFVNDVELRQVGFITDDAQTVGCSPDALIVGRAEALEIKCPAPWTHLQYLIEGPGDDYRTQVQGQLLVGELEAVHFYSYHPRWAAAEIITHRDERFIRILEVALKCFNEQLEERLARCKALGAFVMSRQLRTPIQTAYPEAEPDPIQAIYDAAARHQ